MSADSLFSIVTPAPVPVAAPAAPDARDDSGFDRMVGKAMDGESRQPSSGDLNEVAKTQAGTAAPRPTTSPMAATQAAIATATSDDADVTIETTVVAVASGDDPAAPADADGPALDTPRILPVVAEDKSADAPQVLPAAPPVIMTSEVEALPPPPPSPSVTKRADEPQVLPGLAVTGDTPATTASGKTADGPQVLPVAADKTGPSQGLPVPTKGADPQVQPPVAPSPVVGKAGGPQILPGAETVAQPDKVAEPATPAVTAAGAKAAAAAAAAALAPTVTPPPPLRTLAERTAPVSNSVRATGTAGDRTSVSAPAAGTATATAPAVPAAGATSTTPETASLSDRPLTPAVAAAPVPVPVIDDAAMKSTVDQLPVEAPPVSVTQSGTASQAYSLSNISNAAVEATAQLAAQIIRRMDTRSTRFEMALTPDDLGRVDVSLDIDEHGRLAARLAFDNPAAALDMKGRVDDLRRQLEEAGFHLADDAFQFADRDRSAGEQFDRRQGRAFAAASRLSNEADAAAPVTPPRWMSLSLTPDRVDMKV